MGRQARGDAEGEFNEHFFRDDLVAGVSALSFIKIYELSGLFLLYILYGMVDDKTV